MRNTRLLALVFLAAAGNPGGLLAQVLGLPVRNAGVGTGIGVAADVGFPNEAGGKGFAVGATGAIGLGPLGVTGSVARFDPKGPGDAITSVGATGNLKIFGGPLIPISVTLQAGAAYSKQSASGGGGATQEAKAWHVPVGVGLALTIPNPVFSIKPWLAPRLDVTRATLSNGTGSSTSNTDTNFGISGGVDFGFLNGLTVRTMYDRVSMGNGVNQSVISLGLGFKVGT